MKIAGMTENLRIQSANIPDGEARQIKSELERANRSLEAAINNFNFAEAQEMIDYYTYMIKANEILYNYLNKKYKEINGMERMVSNGVS